MRKLLEKYYNINYYCTYKLLFFIFWRMLNPLYWLCCLLGLSYIKIFRISLLCILGYGVFILLLILIGICGYYVNEIFLLKGDKYKKYFAEFDKKKKYLLYYSIYVVSLIIQFATFYLLFSSV